MKLGREWRQGLGQDETVALFANTLAWINYSTDLNRKGTEDCKQSYSFSFVLRGGKRRDPCSEVG